MGLVPSMGSAMHRQGTALYESLVARFIVTGVGSLVGMYTVVALKVGFPIEALHDKLF